MNVQRTVGGSCVVSYCTPSEMSQIILRVNKVLPNQRRVLKAVTVLVMVRSLVLADTSTIQISACVAITILVLSPFLFCKGMK